MKNQDCYCNLDSKKENLKEVNEIINNENSRKTKLK